MAAQDRRRYIQEELSQMGKVVVSELSSKLGVTEETIRRDLERLEVDGVLKRTYGGAIPNPVKRQTPDVQFYKRAVQRVAEKRTIARNALPLIEGMRTIAADSSTTTAEAVKMVKDRSDLTLLTNSTVAFQELEDSKISVVSTGGEFHRGTLSLRGEAAKSAIKRYRVDALLFSCMGIDENAVFDSRPEESEIKRALIEQAAKVILLADHTKFSQVAFVRVTTLDRIDYLVTDEEPDQRWKDICADHGVTIVY
ncbi:DeoR/GlpR family DNA-binding transcription regulator [Enorma burkinafasonensis]|uniref:DeoR/GlpR family DNA-binding transcription regulator n=1 Tax=Enorma burkinafasonensis TaxID=2590867 RepID=UPI0011A4C70D|nr:DeoR/GlpR family DNA-binding transcription regulator [Enorma burkinafasonensis]